ncbi:MAG TPA: threonine synthase [Saprospiraceae bacterium]|nr:threonine synthase [Saprospirales bacterium]HRQ28514.1 threonine synthase [Saprospiraceae bacterium]
MTDQKFIYKCVNCEKEYGTGTVRYLCPVCELENLPGRPPKGVLKILYDYTALKRSLTTYSSLKAKRFQDILPITNIASLPRLRVGETPLYERSDLVNHPDSHRLFFKDDALNPSFSFKDRASALVSAFAKENGFSTIVAASTGNAGSSIAAICADQGQKAIVLVPEKAPIAKLTQIVMYGAKIIPVKGTYDDAFDLSVEASRLFDWYNRNTAYNPLTIEGKKTVSFELFEQMGYQVPDRIFVPTGDGVILSGVYKGFEDLMLSGITHKMPVVVAVQAAGSDNLVRNLQRSEFEIHKSATFADSISVDAPRNFYMAQHFIKKYNGESITVTDEEIIRASAQLAGQTGIFTEPASASAYAGYSKMAEEGVIHQGSTNVVLLTGSGLKDLKAVGSIISMPESIEKDLDQLKRLAAL